MNCYLQCVDCVVTLYCVLSVVCCVLTVADSSAIEQPNDEPMPEDDDLDQMLQGTDDGRDGKETKMRKYCSCLSTLNM